MTLIDLQRKFLQIPLGHAERLDPDTALTLAVELGQSEEWSSLIGHTDVVILGERGTGKTAEFRLRAAQLLAQGMPAFFCGIGALAANGQGALGHDNLDRLAAWSKGQEVGFFFLDSLDEAKLGRRTLEEALRSLAGILGGNLGRARVIVSSRVSDWRPAHDADAFRILRSSATEPPPVVHVVQVAPLDRRQVARFAAHLGTPDVEGLEAAIHDAGAYQLVQSPLDVQWVASHWKRHGRLGRLLQMIELNVREKLGEDPERRSCLPHARALVGASALAGTATLCRSFAFALPGDTVNAQGDADAIDPRSVLPDWSDDEIHQLLTRPMFDEATYGRVRIHHRSVQEYLAAQWLLGLLQAGMPRRRLDDLLFPNTPTGPAVPRHLGATAAWLAIRDGSVRNALVEHAPEYLIGEGDPASLPEEVRVATLRAYAGRFRGRRRLFHSFDRATLARFASPALVNPINELVADAGEPAELRAMLLDIVAAGRLTGCSGLALQVALDSTEEPGIRLAAIKAVGAGGSIEQRRHLLRLIEHTETAIDQDLAGGIVRALFPDPLEVRDLLRLLSRVNHNRPGVITTLDLLVESEVPKRCPRNQLAALLRGLLGLLDTREDIAERDGPPSEAEPDRSWLLGALAKAVVASLDVPPGCDAPDADTLQALRFLEKNSEQGEAHWHGSQELRHALERRPDVRRAMFWLRAAAPRKGGKKRLTRWFEASADGDLYQLGVDDIPWLAEDAAHRADVWDRLLAFDVLRALPPAGPREDERREAVRACTETDAALRRRLERAARYVSPASPAVSGRGRSMMAKAARCAQQKAETQAALEGRLAGMRAGKDLVALAHAYRSGGRSSYSTLDLKKINEHYGGRVADAVREGLKQVWRTVAITPVYQRSESSTPVEAYLSLAGLTLALEDGTDIASLSPDLVHRASQIALWEINGFPAWFGRLSREHAAGVLEVVAPAVEVEYRAREAHPGDSSVIDHVARSDQDVKRAVLPAILEQVRTGQPGRAKTLEDVTDALVTCDMTDRAAVTQVIAARCMESEDPERFAVWWAAWLELDAEGALKALEGALAGLERPRADAYRVPVPEVDTRRV